MNIKLSISQLVGLIAIVSAIITIIKSISRLIVKGNDILDTVDNNSSSIKYLNKDIEMLSSKIEEILSLQIKQSNTLRDIDRQHIIEITNTILLRESITEEEIYCLSNLYEGYKALGGNSTVDIRVAKALELPVIHTSKSIIDFEEDD